MKILHIIDLMSVGGAQVLIKGIFETYQNPNHFLFVLRKSSDLIYVNHPNVKYSESTSKYSLKAIFELKKHIKKHNIDVIHCYLLKSQIFGFVIKKFWFPKIKMIFHELGEIFMNNRKIYIKFMNVSKKYTDLYFAVSDSTKKALYEKFDIPDIKIVALYNYVISENYKKENFKINIEQKRKEYNIGKEDFVIGYAGRLSSEKGPIHLINALPHIKYNFKLIIAGTGLQHKMLKDKVEKLGMKDKVVFLGFIKDMRSAYSIFDILVIPSEHESFGLVAVEAQCMGIPVIASNVPGLNEVVIENVSGLQFENKNEKNLAEQINHLIEDENLRKTIAQKGMEFAFQFDIGSYYYKMQESYKNLYKK